MIKILMLTTQVRFAVIANRLINFLRHIPLIRRIIKPRLYGDYSLKLIFSAFGILFGIFRKIFFRLFYIGFLVIFTLFIYQAAALGGYQALFAEFMSGDPYFAALDTVQLIYFGLTAWFIFSFAGSFAGSMVSLPQDSDNDIIMVLRMRADCAVYTKSRIVLSLISNILLYLPFVFITFVFTPVPLWCVFPMLFMFAAFRLFGEMIDLLFFRLFSRHLSNFPYTLIGYIVLSAAVFIPVHIGIIDWALFLVNPLVPLGSLIMGILSRLYICRYPLHTKRMHDKLMHVEEMLGKVKEKNEKAGSTFTYVDTSKWHKNVDVSSLRTGKHSGKKGFAYLNAVFFDRHSGFLRKKLLFRCAFIIAPLILTFVFIIYASTMERDFNLLYGREIPFQIAPVFLFVFFIASMGRVVTALVFTNCDIHMLHYTYYRTKETTAASFVSRFAVILRDNLIIAAVMSLSVLGTARLLFGYMDLLNAGIFTVLLLMISVLFAFNDLFLYYVIQPYDSAGHGKSMAYKVINFFIYIFAYINIQMRMELANYTVFIAVLTALYLITGTVLLRTLAPKKFRLR